MLAAVALGHWHDHDLATAVLGALYPTPAVGAERRGAARCRHRAALLWRPTAATGEEA